MPSTTVKRVFYGAALFTALLTASAAEQYHVAVDLLHKGKSFATPKALVNNATPASLSVQGADGFDLTFTVTALGNDTFKIASKLSSAHGNMAPTFMTVKAGGQSSIAADDMEMRIVVKAAATSTH